MRGLCLIALATTGACAGCTTVSLNEYTINQIQTGGDARSRVTLDCLAAVANSADAIPSYALIDNGTVRVTDQLTVGSTTLWSRLVNSFALETLGITASTSPSGLWTFAPVVDHAQLDAMRSACQWVLYGPEYACGNSAGILEYAGDVHTQTAHFGVIDRLKRLPPGWLHVGKLNDIPACARCVGHSGGTWVWVMSEGMEGLNEFTLVLLAIATLDNPAFSNPFLVTLTKQELTPFLDTTDTTGKKRLVTAAAVDRVVKQEYIGTINEEIQKALSSPKPNAVVNLTWAQWMEYTEPYLGTRTNVSAAGSAAPRPTTASAIPQRTFPGPATQSIDTDYFRELPWYRRSRPEHRPYDDGHRFDDFDNQPPPREMPPRPQQQQ